MTGLDSRVPELCRILNDEAHGPDNAISSGELADRVGIEDGEANPTTRKLVREVMRLHLLPIASNGKGYFVATTSQQERDELDSLDGRIREMEERKRLFRRACEDDTRIVDMGEFA